VRAFLLPLLIAPCGLALSRVTPTGRLLRCLTAWLILAATCQNMELMHYRRRKHRVTSALPAGAPPWTTVSGPPLAATPGR
jgi:hypothetical protein